MRRNILAVCVLFGVLGLGASENPGVKVMEYATRDGRLLWEQDRFGVRRDYQYDAAGRMTGIRQNSQPLVSYRYDSRGRLESAGIRNDAPLHYLYDDSDRMIGGESPLGRSRYEYDCYSRLVRQSGAGDYPLAYSYDSWGQMTSYSTGNAGVMKFEYDTAGHLKKRIWPDEAITEYVYTGGKVAAILEAGRKTAYEYDEWGCKIAETVTQGSESLTTRFTYDGNGRMLSAQEGNKHTDFTYDHFGRKLSETTPTGIIRMTYDDQGRLSSREVELRRTGKKFVTGYSYDEAGRLSEVVSPAGQFTYAWTPEGRIAARTVNGKTIANTWKDYRLVSRSFDDSPAVSYQYDDLGRRIGGEYFGVNWKYGYDQYNQLTEAANSKGDTFTYAYDEIGNRLNSTGEKFTYDNANRILNEGYTYDNWGNLVRTPEAEYRYDLRNRLSEVKKQGVEITYIYDALDQRIGSTVNGRNTDFLMSDMIEYARSDGKALFHTLGLDLSGSLNITGGTGAVLASGDTAFLYDGNGNVIAAVENGVVADRIAYDPFGRQTAGKALPFSFSTKYVDGSGLAYYGHRFYDSKRARWINRDPIKEKGGFNLYAFVKNSPLDRFDVKGLALFPWEPTAWGLSSAGKLTFSVNPGCKECCSTSGENGFCLQGHLSATPRIEYVLVGFSYSHPNPLMANLGFHRRCSRVSGRIAKTQEHEEEHLKRLSSAVTWLNQQLTGFFETEAECKTKGTESLNLFQAFLVNERDHGPGAPRPTTTLSQEISASESAGLCIDATTII